ncbi:MAG: hypothetical protein NTY35_05390 [Planctomycetota bacterium]|nr:hypothetical protein [Planctomycetota bacterium]
MIATALFAALLFPSLAPPAAFQSPAALAPLEKKLRSSDDRERQEAVKELAALDGKFAWDLVVGALKDPSPRVADEAEIALAQVSDPTISMDLMGKSGMQSGDAWVAVHAAGALGFAQKPFLPALLAGLQTKSDEAREVLLSGIEDAARGGRIGLDPERALAAAIEKSIQPNGKGGTAQAAALLALAAMEPAQSTAWIARAEAKQSSPHLCALLALAADDRSESAKKLFAIGVAHPDRAVRAQAAAVLAANPDADRLKLLVDLFAAEKNARLFWTIDGHLERLSGLAGGGKVEFWKGWVAKLGPGWKPVTGDARRYAPAGDTEAPKLAGMPILSGGIAILVDFSGSTWQKRPDGTTVKQRLDAELEKALQALPPSARFNVIPYTNAPISWEKKLATATPANVAKALKFFTGCKESGKGNFWDAAMLALEDPDVDTILVLTDGAPTGGRRWNLDLMRARFVEKNRFRHFVLDAVLVDAKKFLAEKWEGWCGATGGRVLALDP